jgi:hypothetical protein
MLRNQCIPIKLRTLILLQFIRPSLTHANIIWAMRQPHSEPPITISTQKFLTLGLEFILGKTMKFKTDSAVIEHKVALLELQVLDVQTYAAQEKIRAMYKYLTNPKVRNKSTYGLMLQASLQEPTPDTISSDYFQTMQATYPELVTLSHNHTQPLKKQDIQFHTSLSFHKNLIESTVHTSTMATYLNNRYYETRDYLLHAKKFFPLEEATTSLANSASL